MQPADYKKLGFRTVASIMDENSFRLSRTRHGKTDTGTSLSKQALSLDGDSLKKKAASNERAVQAFIFDHRSSAAPAEPAEVLRLLYQIADITNDGLVKGGRFRTWQIQAHQRSSTSGAMVSGPEDKVSPDELESACERFGEQLYERWRELKHDPVPIAAWADWELNGGSLHPFYDGCGRIARSFAALLLIRGGCLLPLFDNRTSYFTHGNQGHKTFIDYTRRMIDACSDWLDSGSK